MNLFDKTERAYAWLKFNYFFRGLTTWPVNPNAGVPYRVGVTLDWPNKPEDVVDKQINVVKRTAINIAQKYGLEALMEGPTHATGGALVMYVGLK